MVIYAIRRTEESSERLQQRFKKQVQKSGILQIKRKRGHHKRKPTRRERRLRALKREQFRQQNRKTQFYSNM